MNDKPIYVSFGDEKTEKEFELLKEGKFEEKQLYQFITRAIADLKIRPGCGVKLPKVLWPKTYLHKFFLTNLLKNI